ncbi:MAG: thioredoxin family protein [Kiritimatiellae bacterium]|nr:thioredoxin family protein [Kiritimatiellia bacterium]
MKRIVFLMLAVWAAATRAALAAAERPQVLAFGSSDACEWCKLLERRVFASAAWREWAAGHVTFTRVDLPRGDGVLASEERARNNALADRLGVKGIPTFVVMAPDGNTELGRVKVPDSARGLGRDLTPEAFIAAVEDVLAHDPPASVAQERDPPVGEAASRRFWRMYRFIPVVALLGLAVYLLVDKSKLPLALRGLKKVLGTTAPPAPSTPPVPVWKRLLAFVLILIAFVLAVL